MTAEEKKQYIELINQLRRLPVETEWVEYKENNENPQEVGEYISALSNSAAYCGREKAYLLWGINDKTHEIVGTKFDPKTAKKGNEELENWLLGNLNPRIDISFVQIETPNGKVVVLEVQAAYFRPIAFHGEEFIRVGSYKKKLKDYPEKERRIWLSFEKKPFELRVVEDNLTSDELSELLDFGAFYTLLNLPLPSEREAIIHDLDDEKFIQTMDNGLYEITNMGAILLAKDLRKLGNLGRKAIRVIRYIGNGRVTAAREQSFNKGYAIQFDEIVGYIMSLIPQKEEIDGGRRKEIIMFPQKAIREMLANIMIHQDFTIRGTGPLVEVFDTRVEASSPGALLVDVDRIIDTAPHSRNENIASFMRRVHICEERGSGFDRIEEGMEEMKIPAPKVETGSDFCRTIIYSYPSEGKWTKDDRIRTCYLATCYNYVNKIPVTNSVLRDRFGIDSRNKATMSRIINDTCNADYIKLVDPEAAPRSRKYVPYWA